MQLKDAPAGPDGGLGNPVTLIPIQHRKCHCLFAAMGMLSRNYILLSGATNLHGAFLHAGVDARRVVFDGLPPRILV
jgi:hypothetical protein